MTSFRLTALRPRAISIALPAAVALAGCGRVRTALQPPAPPAPAPARLSDAQQGALYQRQGVIAKQDYLRLVRIQDGINRTQAVSQEDADFLVRQLKSRPVQTASRNVIEAENIVLCHTYGTKPKRLTHSQSQRLYNAILPYAQSPDEGIQVNTTLALASTRDPRAIKVLQTLSQQGRSPLVRRDAAYFLKQLRKALASSGKPGG